MKIYKGFDTYVEAYNEINALLFPGCVTEEEIRQGVGGKVVGAEALIYTLATKRILCWIDTPAVEIKGEALAHGWTLNRQALFKEETPDDRYKLYPEPAEYSDTDSQ